MEPKILILTPVVLLLCSMWFDSTEFLVIVFCVSFCSFSRSSQFVVNLMPAAAKGRDSETTAAQAAIAKINRREDCSFSINPREEQHRSTERLLATSHQPLLATRRLHPSSRIRINQPSESPHSRPSDQCDQCDGRNRNHWPMPTPQEPPTRNQLTIAAVTELSLLASLMSSWQRKDSTSSRMDFLLLSGCSLQRLAWRVQCQSLGFGKEFQSRTSFNWDCGSEEVFHKVLANVDPCALWRKSRRQGIKETRTKPWSSNKCSFCF